MKNYTLVFYADADFNSTNIVSSFTFQCKSITTAYKLMHSYFPEDFVYYKFYDNGKCRLSGTKEKYLSNIEYQIAHRERTIALRKSMR